MVYRGFLVPDNYVSETPDDTDMNISSVFWGLSLGIAIFAAVQAGWQSYHSWKRKHRITTYVALIWGEWIASIIIGALTWCFQREYVGPSYLQFHPVAYLLKLSIEMNMAELTAKIAKSQNLGAIQRLSFITPAEQKHKHDEGSSLHIETINDGDIERTVAPPGRIQLTVKTAVTRQTVDKSGDTESRNSSTQELRKSSMSFITTQLL
ncbi:hypothetical protein THAR02_09926 [Trichoderma harzianum]|uniref:Uncharacterized protein n=1 Tax=Trichoderma harzianum TaxID=5544 RepID=A0A0F9XBF2_TRIHA|nr:hypothetical protein THAR02_09926 [Trichoderma harzianum]